MAYSGNARIDICLIRFSSCDSVCVCSRKSIGFGAFDIPNCKLDFAVCAWLRLISQSQSKPFAPCVLIVGYSTCGSLQLYRARERDTLAVYKPRACRILRAHCSSFVARAKLRVHAPQHPFVDFIKIRSIPRVFVHEICPLILPSAQSLRELLLSDMCMCVCVARSTSKSDQRERAMLCISETTTSAYIYTLQLAWHRA